MNIENKAKYTAGIIGFTVFGFLTGCGNSNASEQQINSAVSTAVAVAKATPTMTTEQQINRAVGTAVADALAIPKGAERLKESSGQHESIVDQVLRPGEQFNITKDLVDGNWVFVQGDVTFVNSNNQKFQNHDSNEKTGSISAVNGEGKIISVWGADVRKNINPAIAKDILTQYYQEMLQGGCEAGKGYKEGVILTLWDGNKLQRFNSLKELQDFIASKAK